MFVDKSQLELALLNLILNARDAMPDGGSVTVAISETSEADVAEAPMLPSGNYLRIRVTDEGNGIAESDIAKITEPFYTTKEAGKGTGLGLSMVLGFVQQSGGRLLITSKIGSGTTIDMILPSTPQPVARKPKALRAHAARRRCARSCWSTMTRRCGPWSASSCASMASTSSPRPTAPARSARSTRAAISTFC